ncbi:MATE family efflux transporter [Sphingomonas sp. MAH-20]|uniref:Multidrug-efflux transporter n=1 Tax=Sphingomonas horti TaxID=2682842 RepID=A0A6I4J4L1_9SPHN|nr:MULTISPECIES: MATE family efflux transporter [Sphingomonas]MBA2919243.1 MATE family efflux transporter [Sphingomonas sp. CGMCC 1.13658]MVO79276.1 MATE family efflux transporter [Sphingomonas horti]
MHAPVVSKAHPWRDEAAATAQLAGPLILTNLAQSAINATDVVLLGWLGARELAAASIGVNLFIAFLIFGMGLVMAASPIMAKQLGARRHSLRETRRTVRQAIWAAITITVPVWLILWHAEPILRLLGQDPGLSADAARFIQPLMFGYLPALGYLVLRAFVAALELPAWATLVSICGVIANALLNYGLIFGAWGLPRLGLFGAGLGSTITQSLMFLGMVVVVTRHRRFRRYRLFGRFWRADSSRYREVWRLGLPIALTLGLEVTVFNAAVFLMGLIGATSLAAHAIAIQIASLTFMVPLGLSQAVTVRVGLAYGRGDPVGIARAGWTAFAMGTAFMAAMAVVMFAMPHTLVGIFLDEALPQNRAVVPLAVSFLSVAALFQVFDGAQSVGAGMLRGLQDTTVPMIYAGFGYWVVGMGTAIWLGFGLGWHGFGIWVGLAAGLAIVSVLMLHRWIRRGRLRLLPQPA